MTITTLPPPMPPRQERLIDRNHIAQMLGISVRQVARNEEKLNLVDCKVVINARMVVYREKEAVKAMREAGVLPKGD